LRQFQHALPLAAEGPCHTFIGLRLKDDHVCVVEIEISYRQHDLGRANGAEI
jgi:hypothetical protein